MSVILRAEDVPAAPELLLRRWHDDDVDALVEAYRDPAMRHWVRTPVRGVRDARQWLDVRRHAWTEGTQFSFAVVEPLADGGDRLLGNVVLKRVDPPTYAEVGYWTTPAARSRGVASRALAALTRWAFTDDRLTRLGLLHQVDNVASCRVAQKTGYRYERTLPARPPFPLDGHVHVRTR